MTLSRRDLLAGMAMQGMLNGWPDIKLMDEDARRAVMMADALIAELDKTEKKSDSDLPSPLNETL